MLSFYGGIDPGYASGAICMLSDDFKEIRFYDIDNKQVKGVKWHTPLIKFFQENKNEFIAIAVEQVSPSFNQGVVSAGHFKGAAMVLEALAECTGAPVVSVLPIKWQAGLGVSVEKTKLTTDQTPDERKKTRKDNKSNLKKSIYAWAKATFPHAELRSFSKDSNRADALGIAFWASQNTIL